jgi:hypothetical protein
MPKGQLESGEHTEDSHLYAHTARKELLPISFSALYRLIKRLTKIARTPCSSSEVPQGQCAWLMILKIVQRSARYLDQLKLSFSMKKRIRLSLSLPICSWFSSNLTFLRNLYQIARLNWQLQETQTIYRQFGRELDYSPPFLEKT